LTTTKKNETVFSNYYFSVRYISRFDSPEHDPPIRLTRMKTDFLPQKSKTIAVLVPAILVVLLSVVSTGCQQEKPPPREIKFRADGVLEFFRPDSTVITRIAIEIAENDSAKTRGLMERRSLPQRGGMLFLYDSDSTRTFWMRNTLVPLDIIFIGSDDTIVNIAKNTRPLSDDLIPSTGSSQNVLEVRAGFSDLHGIRAGTRIHWQRRAS